MRILTCFLPPSSGTASVAGFDVLEQPFEVKKRIGYLPETPPLYPEMETVEYLRFVGKLKGLSGADLQKRVDYVCDRCFIADVKTKLLGKLSKGYRQRVGLAQAIIHNPDVLILDEPTAGLDPKQINETRDLIKSLAGDHTIILSTHILPEVEQTCEQVIIINKGKLVATDSVRNLQAQTRGAETLLIEVTARDGQPESTLVQQKLEAVPGVGRVSCTDHKEQGMVFEVESQKGQLVRGDLARAVVTSGWDLYELRPAAQKPGRDLPPAHRQRGAGLSLRKPLRTSRNHEKYLDHLQQRTAELFRISCRLSAVDHVRPDLRLLLLECPRLFRN